MKATNLTPDDLRNLFRGVGARFVAIDAVTDPKLLKKDRVTGQPNPYVGLVKQSRVFGLVNWVYTQSVNNQREREGSAPDFVAEPRQWGQRIAGESFVEHKGQIYLEMKVQRSLGYRYVMPDGAEIAKEAVEPYLPKKSDGARQELERPVILRDYRVDSIRSVRYNGRRYRVAVPAVETDVA